MYNVRKKYSYVHKPTKNRHGYQTHGLWNTKTLSEKGRSELAKAFQFPSSDGLVAVNSQRNNRHPKLLIFFSPKLLTFVNERSQPVPSNTLLHVYRLEVIST